MRTIHPLNWHIVEPDLIIPGIPRVGSTSVTKGFPYMVAQRDIKKYKRRLAFIRHPIRRLISAFGHLNKLGYIDMVEGDPPKERSWEEFIDYILSHTDRHWFPQIRRLFFNGCWIPTHLERFENLTTVWPRYTDVEFPHFNKTGYIPVTNDYREKEIENYYEKDLELWHGIA